MILAHIGVWVKILLETPTAQLSFIVSRKMTWNSFSTISFIYTTYYLIITYNAFTYVHLLVRSLVLSFHFLLRFQRQERNKNSFSLSNGASLPLYFSYISFHFHTDSTITVYFYSWGSLRLRFDLNVKVILFQYLLS